MTIEDHRLIHSAYCKFTGNYDLVLTMSRHYQWNAWKAQGWTEDDLLLVIKNIKNKIRMGRKWDSALRFSKLIGDTESFGEELCEARALARVPKVDKAKESVLKATGRTNETSSDTVRTAAQVIKGAEELQKLLKLRDSL